MREAGRDGGGRAGRGGATLRVCVTCRWQGREIVPAWWIDDSGEAPVPPSWPETVIRSA